MQSFLKLFLILFLFFCGICSPLNSLAGIVVTQSVNGYGLDRTFIVSATPTLPAGYRQASASYTISSGTRIAAIQIMATTPIISSPTPVVSGNDNPDFTVEIWGGISSSVNPVNITHLFYPTDTSPPLGEFRRSDIFIGDSDILKSISYYSLVFRFKNTALIDNFTADNRSYRIVVRELKN